MFQQIQMFQKQKKIVWIDHTVCNWMTVWVLYFLATLHIKFLPCTMDQWTNAKCADLWLCYTYGSPEQWSPHPPTPPWTNAKCTDLWECYTYGSPEQWSPHSPFPSNHLQIFPPPPPPPPPHPVPPTTPQTYLLVRLSTLHITRILISFP